MKLVSMFRSVVVGAMFFSCMFALEARAASVVFEDVGFISGKGYETHSFTVSSAGRYRATLTDFIFPSAFDDLGFTVTTSLNKSSEIFRAGTMEFNAMPGINYYASIYGDAGGSIDLGLYGIHISSISDMSAVPAVPVPTSVLLMASALVGLAAFGRGGSAAEKFPVADGLAA